MRPSILVIFILCCTVLSLAQERALKTDVLWYHKVKIGTDYGHSAKHLEGYYKNQDKLDINRSNTWIVTDSTLTRKLRWVDGSKVKSERMTYTVEHLSNVTYRDSGEAGIFLDRTYITQDQAFIVTINHHTGYAEVNDLVNDICYLSREAQLIWYYDTKYRESIRAQPTTWRKKSNVLKRRRGGPRR